MTEEQLRKVLWDMFTGVSGIAETISVRNASRAIDYAIKECHNRNLLTNVQEEDND